MGKLIPFEPEKFFRKRIDALPTHSPRRKVADRALKLWKRAAKLEKKHGSVQSH